MSADLIDTSDIEPAETTEQEIDVYRVLEGLLNNCDGQSLLRDLPPGSVPYAKYRPARDPEDAGEWWIAVGDLEGFISIRELPDCSDAPGYGREVAWAICHAGLAILQLLKRIEALESPRNPPGNLLAGIDPVRSEVVINLDRDRTGHITFTPNQARELAHLLQKKAHEIDAR